MSIVGCFIKTIPECVVGDALLLFVGCSSVTINGIYHYVEVLAVDFRTLRIVHVLCVRSGWKENAVGCGT